jgi:hypothetical protein
MYHPPSLLQKFSFSGGHSEGETPVPIPNTEVKPLSADGTALYAVWESRTPPGNFCEGPTAMWGLLLCAPVVRLLLSSLLPAEGEWYSPKQSKTVNINPLNSGMLKKSLNNSR